MKVFRLSKKKYAEELSGKGASKSGNRWNSKGTEIIYTAESRSLAMAELVIHLSLVTLPRDFVMMEIDIPETIKIKELKLSELQENWNQHPTAVSTQKIGDKFIGSTTHCVVKVPSALVNGDFNYLLNPYHKDFKKIKIENIYDFPINRRIFK